MYEVTVPRRNWAVEYANPTGMIAFTFLCQTRLLPYEPASISPFLNSPNYTKPPSSADFLKKMLGDGLLIAEFEDHKRQRRILNPAFAVGHLRRITQHFWLKANQLVECWKPLVENQDKEGIEVLEWMSRVALDIIGLAGFL
jgi:cytochrome P450